MFWMRNKLWVLRLQEKLSAKSYGLRSCMRYLILPPVRFDCKIVCSHWLLKMRKLEKLTRFCQICCAASGTGGVEKMGNCEERKKQRPGGSKSLLVHSLEVRKDTKITFFFCHNLIYYRIHYMRGGSSSLCCCDCSSVSRLQLVPRFCCARPKDVSLRVKDAKWGWEKCEEQNGGRGGSTSVLWEFSDISSSHKCIYDQSVHHRDLMECKTG